MKKGIKIAIIASTILMMSLVWPFCLVRKDADVSSALDAEYLKTEQYITAENPYQQTFVAQTAWLDKIDFVVAYDAELPADGKMIFELKNSKGERLVNREIDFSEIKNRFFCPVTVKSWLKTGEEYQYTLVPSDGNESIFYGVYTAEPEAHAPGNTQLRVGGQLVDGQGVSRYTYGYPLNIKNVICIWAFILTAGMVLLGMINDEKENDSKLSEKCDAFICKYQAWILWAELIGIIAVTAYICRNITVDWDEAYSFRMVYKLSFSEMIATTATDIHPPLYYILLRLFSMIFGTEFFTLKMFSVLFIGLTMVLGITYVRKNWGFAVAFVFNLVVGLGPQFIFYSVNIRMYSMALFFVTWSMLLAYEIIKEDRPIHWILFVLSGLGGAFTHYFAVVPMALIYAYLMIGLIIFNRKKLKLFVIACVATVLGYLPWLSVMLSSFERMGTTGQVDWKVISLVDYAKWAFSTNIKWSEIMPVVLLVLGVILLVWSKNRFEKKEKLFLGFCVVNSILSYVVCRLIASLNEHFWDNRYVFAAIGMFWLFLSVMYARGNKKVFLSYTVWLSIMVASAFVIQKAEELGTVEYITETDELLEQVRDETTVIYDFEKYDVLYGAHLTEQEFVWFDDVNFDEFDKDYVYFIAWGGKWFSDEETEKYQIQAEDCGTMRFEQGVAKVKLYKINFVKMTEE